MQKEEVFKQILAKGIQKSEINEKFEEAKKFMESKGVKREQIENFALSRLMSYYKRVLFSPSKTFEGIIYGVDRETDYGAQAQYDESIEKWNENKDAAINDGYTDEEGTPLYHGKRAPAKGIRKIDLDKDRGKPIYLVAREVNDEDFAASADEFMKKDGIKRAILTLKSDLFDLTLPMFELIRFKAIKGTKSTDDLLIMSQSKLTEFEVIDKKEISFPDIAKKYLKHNICTNLRNLVQWHKDNEADKNRQVIIKGNVVELRITNEGISNLVTLNAEELDSIDDKPITCWIPEDTVIDFDENAMEVIIVGRTNLNDDDGDEKVTINAVSLWCPPAFRIQRNHEDDIDESRINEKIVASTPEEEEIDDEVQEIIERPAKVETTKPVPISKREIKAPAQKKLKKEEHSDDVGDW